MTVPRMEVVSCKRPKRRSYFLLLFCQVRTELIFHESNHIQAFQFHDELLYDRDDCRVHVNGRFSHGGGRGAHGCDGHGRGYQVFAASQWDPTK
jgi:hypothetical protein